jgi:hypothetical protein
MKAMLTTKQNGVRVVNPDLLSHGVMTSLMEKEELFPALVVECGFQASHRDNVWTHTKDDQFSVQLDTKHNRFLFEYKYKSGSEGYSPDMTNFDFISRFLGLSREFFVRVKNPSNQE